MVLRCSANMHAYTMRPCHLAPTAKVEVRLVGCLSLGCVGCLRSLPMAGEILSMRRLHGSIRSCKPFQACGMPESPVELTFGFGVVTLTSTY